MRSKGGALIQRITNLDSWTRCKSLDFPRGSIRGTQWAQNVLGQIALIAIVISRSRKGKVCERGIVFGSQRSMATISAPSFNSGYWPGSHCSPAFPNLGQIPLSGNIVYKRRHRASATPKSPSIYFSYDPLLLSPLALSLLPLSQLGFGIPWIIPPGSFGDGSSLWPLHTWRPVSFCFKLA